MPQKLSYKSVYDFINIIEKYNYSDYTIEDNGKYNKKFVEEEFELFYKFIKLIYKENNCLMPSNLVFNFFNSSFTDSCSFNSSLCILSFVAISFFKLSIS